MDERARALEEAYATIARVEAQEAEREPREYEPYVMRQPERRIKRRRMTEPQMETSMDEATQAQWNAWANALVHAKMEALADIIGGEIGLMEKRFNGRLKELEDRIADLTAQLELLRTAKNVTPFRAARDVA